MTGLVGVFVPFSRTMDLIFAIGGCLLFSGYIVFDTYVINKRLSPDEYIMGAISLYLEWVLLASNYNILINIGHYPASSISVSVSVLRYTPSLISLIFLVISILRLLNNLQDN